MTPLVPTRRSSSLPEQMKEHGGKGDEWRMSETALRDLIRLYTREAGVRNLEREIANLVRKAVKEIAVGDSKAVKLDRRNLDKYAGVRSEEHTSELQSLMRISYAVFCLKKKKKYSTKSTTD